MGGNHWAWEAIWCETLNYFISKYDEDIAGDMVYFSVAGQNLIYVNSFDVAIDLFEKRSSRYSDRAHTTMMTM